MFTVRFCLSQLIFRSDAATTTSRLDNTMPSTRSTPQPKLSAILSSTIHDIPVWARTLVVIAGLAGVVVIIVGSLIGRTEQTIEVDKLLHFGGYTTLATIFVLGLRPSLYLTGLFLLAALSIAIEFIQPLTGRSFDTGDMAANLIGIVTGLGLGLILRIAGRVVTTQLKQARLRKQRRSYSKGSILLKQGAPITRFMVIERGQVQLSREVNGQRQILGVMGPGEIIGLLGVVQSQPQYATVEALEETIAYSLEMSDLTDSSEEAFEPVTVVLQAMARQIRELADRVVASDKPLA